MNWKACKEEAVMASFRVASWRLWEEDWGEPPGALVKTVDYGGHGTQTWPSSEELNRYTRMLGTEPGYEADKWKNYMESVVTYLKIISLF
jgi:hypothetical protein